MGSYRNSMGELTWDGHDDPMNDTWLVRESEAQKKKTQMIKEICNTEGGCIPNSQQFAGASSEDWQKHAQQHKDILKPSNNPKDAVGSDKLPLHLWPMSATIQGTLGLLDGMLKYGRGNWRAAGVRYTIYLDAIERHCRALLEGEDTDPDSGLPHISHILASAAILADAGACGQLIDDRNYQPPKDNWYRSFIDTLTCHVIRLKEKHKDKTPKHWSIQDGK